MEQLLHYVWKHRLFPLAPLRTTEGEAIDVLDPGLHNRDAGPDFFNAKVSIGGTVWVGHVELHLQTRDWYRHGHHTDKAYNNVILHVVCEADREATTENGITLPQLQLEIPDGLRKNYEHLLSIDRYPRCHRVIPKLDTFKVHNWMDTLLQERLRSRAYRVTGYLKDSGGDWEKALFVALARNFGFALNAEAFVAWAHLVPLEKIGKHRDDLFQIEAIFLGQAGMLEAGARPEAEADEYRRKLQREYSYQQRLFDLPPALPLQQWRYLRLRPQNFPHIRLAQLAWIYSNKRVTMAGLRDALSAEEPMKSLLNLLKAETSPYWTEHLMFGKPVPRKSLTLSPATRRLIIINTVIPVLYAHAIAHSDPATAERLEELLRQMPAEDNHILRLWQECGLDVSSAADGQALIHLKNEYCDRRDCLRCAFGYEYMKGEA